MVCVAPVTSFVPGIFCGAGPDRRAVVHALWMRTALVAASLMAAASFALAQDGAGPYKNTYTITHLAEGVHTLTWATPAGSPVISNSTFIVGEDDAIVIDTGLSRSAGEAILEGLRKVTDKPVSMVINTHWHGDHIFGNQAFRRAFPAARFVAHGATRDGIITGEVSYRDVNQPKTEARIKELRGMATRTDPQNRELASAELLMDVWQGDYVLPDVLVDQRLTVMQGLRKIVLLHLGVANTPGDLVVHLPAERIVINGDMAITPVQFAFFSSPRAWIRTLERLAALDAATFVPGHGPVQRDTRFVTDLQAMLRSLVEQVDAGLADGLAVEALRARVRIVPPAGSIYEKASPASLDRNFRLPGIDSAIKEKG
jgi:glyoxylase-like metal-dependent hydrolase (beta-lactamase superfamily II)